MFKERKTGVTLDNVQKMTDALEVEIYKKIKSKMRQCND